MRDLPHHTKLGLAALLCLSLVHVVTAMPHNVQSIATESSAKNTVKQLVAVPKTPMADGAIHVARVPEVIVEASYREIVIPNTFAQLLGGKAINAARNTNSATKTFPVKNWRPHGGFKVSQALLLAIAKKESRFRPQVTSPAGAKGVMQVLPATAQYIIRKKRLNEIALASNDRNTRIPRISHSNLFDPQVNMTIAQAYLEYLSEKPYIQGSLVKLLAAYNAGPGMARKWNEQFAGKSEAEFAKNIPFRETRHYVRDVMQNYLTYCHILGETPVTSL